MRYELTVCDKNGRIDWRAEYKTLAAACADAEWYIKEGQHIEINSKKN